jgi:hypothetical protein
MMGIDARNRCARIATLRGRNAMEMQQSSRHHAAARLASVLPGRAPFLGALGALMIAAGSAAAAPSQVLLPDSCSASDRALIVSGSEAQLEALVSGDLAGYARLSNEMEASLSRACRSGLDKLAPARTRCSAREKQLVLAGVQAIMEAAIRGDLATTFEQYDELEGSVSHSCWIAVNRSQHPAVQRACTSSELDAIAGVASPVMHAIAEVSVTGDIAAFVQTTQELEGQLAAKLSLKCQGALVQVQREAQQSQVAARRPSGSGNPQNRPSFVHDHGGGTYSVSGVGACTPSGCMAF